MTTGSGNIFSDLGFPPAEARVLQLRSQLMMALRKLVEQERIPEKPWTSDLMRGKINRFSLDTLVAMLTTAGIEFDLRVRTRPRRVA